MFVGIHRRSSIYLHLEIGFEILNLHYGYISPSADTLDVLLNHFTPHSFYVVCIVTSIFLENSHHLGTKTLTGYCDHRASFNEICLPTPN